MVRNACLAVLAFASVSLVAGSASAQFNTPAIGSNPNGPEYLITYNANGTFTTGLNLTYSSNPGPYDGQEDTYFGVVNNNAGVLHSLFLSGGPGSNIFGFDGEGIGTYPGVGTNANDKSSGLYGGPNAYFNVVNSDSGTVIFGSGIKSGGTDIFSLEEAVAINTLVVNQGGVPEPSTWAMMLLGFAGLGFLSYRQSRKQNRALIQA
jgi:hypothetical protein